jgi:hypothetical protein
MPIGEWWIHMTQAARDRIWRDWQGMGIQARPAWVDYVNARWQADERGAQAQALGPGQPAVQNWGGQQGLPGQLIQPPPPQIGERRLFNGFPYEWVNIQGVIGWQRIEQPEAADNMPENLKLLNSWRVGTDPEFVVFDGANIKDMKYLIPHDGPVGYDHGGRVAEIRPVASRSCSQVVRNIQKLIKEDPAALKLAAYKWRAGAVVGDATRKECLGGHVHLDMPLKDARASLGALDAFTKQIEGVDMLPTKECEERRLLFNGQYGKMDGGDGHVRAAGRNQRLEYRAVASWLFSPKTALFCLTGYKLALFAPAISREFLAGPASNRRLRLFFEAFRHKDDDADRILEGIDSGGIKSWRGLHDGDVKQTWQEIPV